MFSPNTCFLCDDSQAMGWIEVETFSSRVAFHKRGKAGVRSVCNYSCNTMRIFSPQYPHVVTKNHHWIVEQTTQHIMAYHYQVQSYEGHNLLSTVAKASHVAKAWGVARLGPWATRFFKAPSFDDLCCFILFHIFLTNCLRCFLLKGVVSDSRWWKKWWWRFLVRKEYPETNLDP